MVLHLIGLGLGDHEDITVKGLRIVKACARVYLEAYTSILCGGPTQTHLVSHSNTGYHQNMVDRNNSTVDRSSSPIASASSSKPTQFSTAPTLSTLLYWWWAIRSGECEVAHSVRL